MVAARCHGGQRHTPARTSAQNLTTCPVGRPIPFVFRARKPEPYVMCGSRRAGSGCGRTSRMLFSAGARHDRLTACPMLRKFFRVIVGVALHARIGARLNRKSTRL